MSEMTNRTKEVAGGGDMTAAEMEAAELEAALAAAAAMEAALAGAAMEVSDDSEDSAEAGTEERKCATDGDTEESSKKKKKKKHNEFGTPNYGDNPSPEARELVQLVLDHFNDSCARLSAESPDLHGFVEWGFSGGLHVNAFVDDGIWYHLNFRVEVVIDDCLTSHYKKDGPYLVFAEVRLPRFGAGYQVVFCEDLGPEKYVALPRMNGCKACAMPPHAGVLVHPDREFNVGTTPVYS